MTTTITFVPSGTPVTFVPTEASTSVAMPTVDGSNTDLMITSATPMPAYLTFGAVVATGDARLRGDVVVPGNGQPILLTATPATAAAGVADALVIFSSAQATATFVSAIAGMRGGTITIQRGTATPRSTF